MKILINNARYLKPFFLGRRWINNQRKSIYHSVLENNRAYLLRTEITKSHLTNRICQLCAVKTSTVTPSFYYVFNIFLSCNINIPSFIENLWWDLLLGNHLKSHFFDSHNHVKALESECVATVWHQNTIFIFLFSALAFCCPPPAVPITISMIRTPWV